MGPDVTVLYFAGCPSWRTALERVKAAAERAGVDVQVTARAVVTDEDADLLGFTGSPTILIGGQDPFCGPGMAPALACRVYSTPDGLAGSPTVDQLVHVLEEHGDLAGGGSRQDTAFGAAAPIPLPGDSAR